MTSSGGTILQHILKYVSTLTVISRQPEQSTEDEESLVIISKVMQRSQE